MRDNKDEEIIDELLGLNTESTIKDDTTIEEVQSRIIKEMKKEELISDVDNTPLDPRNETFVSIIKDNVNYCIGELKEVNEAMNKIKTQKNSEMFFRKSENIKLLSEYMSKMAEVNQKTLDLLILLLGSSGKISDEYETILSTIDELGELNNGEAEVLNYLIKVKKMIYEIRDNDNKLKQVMEDNAITKEIVTLSEEKIKKELEESQKARKTIDSKCNRLQRRIRTNNLYIGVCLLLIIALIVFIGVKFYVL